MNRGVSMEETEEITQKTIEETIVEEIKNEQHPQEDDTTLMNYVKEAEYSINGNCGIEIDYEEDLEAKVLVKNYVLYRRYNRLAEFKQLYGGEYANLQAKYYPNTSI